MHEMSVVTSLLSIVREEMEKHDVHRLLLVRVRYGALSNIVPEAFPLPLRRLRREPTSKALCWKPKRFPSLSSVPNADILSPAVKGEHFFAPCPACGEQYGHSMETGRELYVQHIEAE